MKEKHININEFIDITGSKKAVMFGDGTESQIYEWPYNKEDVFKFFLVTIKDSSYNKAYILNNLSDIADNYPLPFLTLPKELVVLDEKDISLSPIGYTMELLHGKNLSNYLDEDIPFEKKKELLIKTGKLLEKMKEMRKETGAKLFLNDLHEDNIIVENNSNELKVIDIDSTYVNDAYVAPSKYLLKKEFLKDRVKYPKEKNNYIYGRQIIPSQNTEYYCYIIMILNTLLQERSTMFSYRRMNNYIDYLEDLGTPKELIASFRRLFQKEDNTNPYEYLDDLKENHDTSFERFRTSKKF